MLELTHFDRKRIFNLGYFTWVEQQDVSIEDFERRREERFWRDLVETIPVDEVAYSLRDALSFCLRLAKADDPVLIPRKPEPQLIEASAAAS